MTPTGSGSERSTAKAATAPHPDDPRKPDSPGDVTKPGWKYTLKKTLREFNRDQCTDLAAALTYYAVFAIAPASLALVSLLGVFGNGQEIVDSVMRLAKSMGAPDDAIDSIEPIVTNLSQQQGAGLSLALGLLLALWSASGYVNAFGRAMNRMYEIDEGRPFWKLRPIMLLTTLVLLLLVALILVALVVSGGVAEAVGDVIGLSEVAVTVWNIAKWPVVLGLVVVLIALLYYATPNVKQPKLRWMSVGSVVAIVVWVLATVGFAFYVTNFGKYEATYGALAGVILFLLWLWITNNALLFGAELDAELERTRELQAGIRAEETIQLPPRDTKASEKKQKKHAEDVETGRALRLSAGQDDDLDDEEAAAGPEGDRRSEAARPEDVRPGATRRERRG